MRVAKGWRKRRRRRKRPQKPAGAPPGTLIPDPEAPAPVIRVMAYGPEECVERQADDVEDISELLGTRPVTWVNVDGLGDLEMLSRIAELFDVHPLVLEDIVHTRQRPKLEEYGSRLFIVARMPDREEGGLLTEQLALLLGEGFVLTFQEREGDCLEPVRARLRNGRGQIRDMGADYLVYALLDAVVDSYFPILEAFGERLEELEDEVVGGGSGQTITHVHDMKQDLLAVRRAIWPLRDVLNALLRDPASLVTPETRIYLRDCYDHAVGLIDLTETYREMGSSLTDLYVSSISNRVNEVMKVLTVMATIFIPLTFITGVYGMNFNTAASPWNMPELDWYFGYPAALGVMLLTAIGLIVYFRRRRWIG